MRHIGLFAGIGGFELAARWMGWNTIAWSEWDPFCQKVLSYHFPEAKGYGDIKQADFTEFRGQCDILTGGFPCQPYSVAGKRLGKEDERDSIPNHWENFPTIAPVCGGDDGLPSELDGITFPKWRKESIKAYGNAIVPQVAYQLFQAINFTESLVY